MLEARDVSTHAYLCIHSCAGRGPGRPRPGQQAPRLDIALQQAQASGRQHRLTPGAVHSLACGQVLVPGHRAHGVVRCKCLQVGEVEDARMRGGRGWRVRSNGDLSWG